VNDESWILGGYVKVRVVKPGRKDLPAGHNFDEIKK